MLLYPACIREQYTFQLTGVSFAVSDLVMSASATGHSVSGTQSTILELHKLQSHRKELVYIDSLPRLRPDWRAPPKLISETDAAASSTDAADADSNTAAAVPVVPASASTILATASDGTAAASVAASQANASTTKQGALTAGQYSQRSSSQPTIKQSIARACGQPDAAGMLISLVFVVTLVWESACQRFCMRFCVSIMHVSI